MAEEEVDETERAGREESAGRGGWVLHVISRGASDRPRPPATALEERGPARAAAVEVAGSGWIRSGADALRVTGRLRRRPDPGEAMVRWPEIGPVPVLHAHGPAALRAAWLGLCLTGAPARLTARWTGEGLPPYPAIWRRLDVAMAGSPAAARALRSAGLAGRRIRLVEDGNRTALSAVYRELSAAPVARTRRVDWALRPRRG